MTVYADGLKYENVVKIDFEYIGEDELEITLLFEDGTTACHETYNMRSVIIHK